MEDLQHAFVRHDSVPVVLPEGGSPARTVSLAPVIGRDMKRQSSRRQNQHEKADRVEHHGCRHDSRRGLNREREFSADVVPAR